MAWSSRLVSRLSRLRSLSAEERAALGEAVASLACVRVTLALFPPARLARELTDSGEATAIIDADRWAQCTRLERMVSVAGRLLPGTSTCLHRSIVLRRMLARRGLCARLRLGVRKSPDAFEAHAWVELAGRVLNDRADVAERYVPLQGMVGAGGLPPRGAYST